MLRLREAGTVVLRNRKYLNISAVVHQDPILTLACLTVARELGGKELDFLFPFV